MDNGITALYTDPSYVANPDTSGNGYIRIILLSSSKSSLNGITDSTQALLVDELNAGNWTKTGCEASYKNCTQLYMREVDLYDGYATASSMDFIIPFSEHDVCPYAIQEIEIYYYAYRHSGSASLSGVSFVPPLSAGQSRVISIDGVEGYD